jgi:hypothetical protein
MAVWSRRRRGGTLTSWEFQSSNPLALAWVWKDLTPTVKAGCRPCLKPHLRRARRRSGLGRNQVSVGSRAQVSVGRGIKISVAYSLGIGEGGPGSDVEESEFPGDLREERVRSLSLENETVSGRATDRAEQHH